MAASAATSKASKLSPCGRTCSVTSTPVRILPAEELQLAATCSTAGTQFTCVTSTPVHILTAEELQLAAGAAGLGHHSSRSGMYEPILS